jgi:hypothetical protein
MLLHPLMVVALLASTLVVPEPPKKTSPYGVRPATPMAQTIIDDASDRSPTIRALLDDLSKSDVIVHVGLRYDRPSRQGSTSLVTATPVARYVRIDILARLAPPRRAEVLAHELYHALEIAKAPDVRDDAGMRELFDRIGWRAGKHYETSAALAVEHWVRDDWAVTGFDPVA